MRRIQIFDTTLRDGEQAPGNSMIGQTRLEVFEEIATTGVDYVEAGFPAVSKADFETVRDIARSKRDVAVTAFARATKQDIDCSLEALDGRPATQLEVLLTGSEIHVVHKRRKTIEEIERETREAVSYAHSCGVTDLSLAFEDATRGSLEFLRRVVEIGVEAGGTTVCLPDTVGQATPESITRMVRAVRSWVG